MYWKSHPDTCHCLHMLMYWNSLGEANVQYQPILFQFVRTSLYTKTETRICFALLSVEWSPPLDTSHFPSANVNNYRALFTEEDGKSLRQCNWYWTFQDFFKSFEVLWDSERKTKIRMLPILRDQKYSKNEMWVYQKLLPLEIVRNKSGYDFGM